MASLNRVFLGPSSHTSIPLFLAPAFSRASSISNQTKSHFSTSTPLQRASATRKQAGIKAATSGKPNWSLKARPTIDRNKKRGVSAIRRTGPRSTRGLWNHPLPVPVARDHRGTSAEYTDSQDHGLWGFFGENRQALLEPDEESSHGAPVSLQHRKDLQTDLVNAGRAWEYKELSIKSFDDLHKLYWVSIKELNRTLTREKERDRLRAGYGQSESEERTEVVSHVAHIKRRRANVAVMNKSLSLADMTFSALGHA